MKGGNASNNAVKLELDPKKLGLSAPTLQALKEWESPSMTGYRIMVFLPSNAYLDFFADVFAKEMPKVKTFVLHGGLSQGQRSKTSEAFRVTDNCVLFTSDASARGVDYPDVSCVVQVGFDSRAEYLQRVGRTGRAGKSGTTYIVVAPEENAVLKDICDVLTEIYAEAPDKPICNKPSKPFPSNGVKYPESNKLAKGALRGWLGALASKWKRLKMTPEAVVSMAQKQAIAMGVGDMPTAKLYEKLNIKVKAEKPEKPEKPEMAKMAKLKK
jgi:ATP-dependent RNA helicase MSS116